MVSGGHGERGYRWLLPLLLLGQLLLSPPAMPTDGVVVPVLDLRGPIGPASMDYLVRGLDRARRQQVPLVVLRLDTPGGLDSAMRGIVQAILASPVPVVGYVAPPGARAASAGTYILYACHVAAMAPGTNLGAATPVRIGGIGAPAGKGDTGRQADQDAMHHKLVNDAAAYLRSLARLRGRNADWAEKAVREGASLTAREALQAGVVDLVADDLDRLLQALDGREVKLPAGLQRLHTTGLGWRLVPPDWRNRFLSRLADPNLAYILMLLGVYGLFFELVKPGFMLPGVVGAISLVLALYAFQVLPVNYAGIGLILLGIGFMVAEAFVPSFGALGLGGLIAFVVGSVILYDSDSGLAVSPLLVGTLALASGAFFIGVMGLALRARRRPVVSGREELIGARAEVLDDFTGRGRVRVHGEIWQARSHRPLRRGAAVRVTGIQGLVLEVEPMTEEAG